MSTFSVVGDILKEQLSFFNIILIVTSPKYWTNQEWEIVDSK